MFTASTRAAQRFGSFSLHPAYANEHRPWQLHRTVFEQLLAKCLILVASQPETRKRRKFRFKNPLLILGVRG
jgi:hypothetical protein